MLVQIFNLQTHEMNEFNFDLSKSGPRDQAYKVGDYLTIDFKTGKIDISKRTDSITEYICLAFTISVLFTLCAPRPDEYAATTERYHKLSCIRCVKRPSPECLMLISAGGYLTDRPTNKLGFLQNSDNQWELGIGTKLFKFSHQSASDIYTQQSSNGSYINPRYKHERAANNNEQASPEPEQRQAQEENEFL